MIHQKTSNTFRVYRIIQKGIFLSFCLIPLFSTAQTAEKPKVRIAVGAMHTTNASNTSNNVFAGVRIKNNELLFSMGSKLAGPKDWELGLEYRRLMAPLNKRLVPFTSLRASAAAIPDWYRSHQEPAFYHSVGLQANMGMKAFLTNELYVFGAVGYSLSKNIGPPPSRFYNYKGLMSGISLTAGIGMDLAAPGKESHKSFSESKPSDWNFNVGYSRLRYPNQKSWAINLGLSWKRHELSTGYVSSYHGPENYEDFLQYRYTFYNKSPRFSLYGTVRGAVAHNNSYGNNGPSKTKGLLTGAGIRLNASRFLFLYGEGGVAVTQQDIYAENITVHQKPKLGLWFNTGIGVSIPLSRGGQSWTTQPKPDSVASKYKSLGYKHYFSAGYSRPVLPFTPYSPSVHLSYGLILKPWLEANLSADVELSYQLKPNGSIRRYPLLMGPPIGLKVIPVQGRMSLWAEASISGGATWASWGLCMPPPSPARVPYMAGSLSAGLRYNIRPNLFADFSTGLDIMKKFEKGGTTPYTSFYSRLALGWRFGKPGDPKR